jgi:8-oxo-dGTP pyrophosphatase MutT (NUDIX family)
MSVPVSWPDVQLRLARLLAPPTTDYVPFRVDQCVAGWITPARCAALARFSDTFRITPDAVEFVATLAHESARSRALAVVAEALAREGALSQWRDERYDIAPVFGAAPWFRLERAAARYFGVHTHAVHANGLVRVSGQVHMWLARRSPTKAIDPGKLDNLVGGGLASGSTVAETLRKEAWEEAGIPDELAHAATATGSLRVHRDQPDGLHSETIFVHDWWLPPAFVPANQDGEACEHRLVDLAQAARLIGVDSGPEEVTADASLVVLDCLLRMGAGPPDAPERTTLRAFGRSSS